MNKLTMIVIVSVVCLAGIMEANAHAVRIESNAKATKNKVHEVKIFYGEYPEGTVEPTEKWYSDLKTLEVWVISPSKNKTKLVLTDAADHLKSSFVPVEHGIYYITTVHSTEDLGGTTRYEFSSVASVLSGSATAASVAPEQSLSIIVRPSAYKTSDLVELQVWKAGEAFVDAEVKIMSPEGWVKTVKTDGNGRVSFTPKLKGNYVIETSDYKKEDGEWNQKQYTHTWKGSTTRIMVN